MNFIKSLKFSDLPNIITIFRVLCIPVIILCLLPQNTFFNWIALIFFGAACISDFFDGYIARKYDLESTLGKFLDPIADKILVISIIFVLVAVSKVSGLLVIPCLIIVIREVSVTGLREFFAETKPSINVTNLSKIKTLLQMFSLAFIIIGDDFLLLPELGIVGEFGLWISSFLTIYTGYVYFKNSLSLFK